MPPNRRKFLQSSAVALVATTLSPLATQRALAATRVPHLKGPRTLVGYCWPNTVRAGERLEFMVSATGDRPFSADLVRIICGDNLSSPAMYKEELLKAPFEGLYPPRYQQTHLGSYAEIAPKPVLDMLTSFTVQAMCYPTLLPNEAPSTDKQWTPQDQHLIARWDNVQQQGWALLIDQQGRLVFMMGDGQQLQRTQLEPPLIKDQWFSVMASYDADKRLLQMVAKPCADSPADLVAWPEVQLKESLNQGISVVQRGPLRFAACSDGPGHGKRHKPAACFNGKLDRVRLSSAALNAKQVEMLTGTDIPSTLRNTVVGFWDFSQGIDGLFIHDRSEHRLDGETVNIPLRAVTGVDWDGSVHNWRQNPDHYSAIYFHDDDLYDAQWTPSFAFTVPKHLPTGIYAARLQQGESEDYIPFFVAPPKNKPTAKVALLVPTATYTAYTNIDWVVSPEKSTVNKVIKDSDGANHIIKEDALASILADSEDAEYLLNHLRSLGKGLYCLHSDGSYCTYASKKHPNMLTKPKSFNWTLVSDTYITDWLQQIGIDYDIITDDLLHQEGVTLLKDYNVIMTGNHPEYYSKVMLDAVEQYQQQGGRWMYLGGNGFYWVTSFPESLPGAMEVRKGPGIGGTPIFDYERHHAFEDIHGGLWASNGRAPQLLMGVGMDGVPLESSTAYQRLPDSYDPRADFIFADVSNTTFGDYGILGGGAAGQETDIIDYSIGTPSHALHLARSEGYISKQTAEAYRSSSKVVYADMVYFELPNGGAVFSVGSMAWIGALSHNNYQNDVARITENVLRRFAE